MIETLKRGARRVLPPAAIQSLRQTQTTLSTRKARQAFEAAGTEPAWLNGDRIAEFQARYPKVPPYKYDAKSLSLRGEERVRLMRPYVPRPASGTVTSLEIGASDAMVSCYLAQAGVTATALDLDETHLDPRAVAAGVDFRAGNAMDMPFADASFDFACTYNSFEHFADPRGALEEALRVVKPGGVLFIRFGPLYRAPFGLHAFHAVRIPFCQHLFEREALAAYTQREGLRDIPFETLNEWTIRQFRELFDSKAQLASRQVYREIPDVHGIGLVAEHPSCFRAETKHFEDLTVSGIEMVLRRI